MYHRFILFLCIALLHKYIYINILYRYMLLIYLELLKLNLHWKIPFLFFYSWSISYKILPVCINTQKNVSYASAYTFCTFLTDTFFIIYSIYFFSTSRCFIFLNYIALQRLLYCGAKQPHLVVLEVTGVFPFCDDNKGRLSLSHVFTEMSIGYLRSERTLCKDFFWTHKVTITILSKDFSKKRKENFYLLLLLHFWQLIVSVRVWNEWADPPLR